MKKHQLIGCMVLLLQVRGVQEESDCKNWTINDCDTKIGDPNHKIYCYNDEFGNYGLCKRLCRRGLSKKCTGYCKNYIKNCHPLTTTPGDASSLPADISAPPIGNTATTQVVMPGTSQQNSHESTTAALNPRNVVTPVTVSLIIFIILLSLGLCIVAVGFDKELFKSRISDVRARKWPRKNNFKQRENIGTQTEDMEEERNQICANDRIIGDDLRTGRYETSFITVQNGSTRHSGNENSVTFENEFKEECTEEQLRGAVTAPTTRTHRRRESSLVAAADIHATASSAVMTFMSTNQLMKRLAEAADLRTYICVLNDYITEMNNREEADPRYWKQVKQKWTPLFKELLVSTNGEPKRCQRTLSNETTASGNLSSQPPAKGLMDAKEDGENQALLGDEERSVAASEFNQPDLEDVNFTDIKLYDIKLIITLHMAIIQGALALES